MKVAITIWNDRISPVFDTAGRILVVEIEGGEERSRQEHLLEEIYPPWRVRRLKNLGVEVLICGAVSNPVAALIDSAGIRLVPWVSGDAEEVLGAFRAKALDAPRYLMPGCRGRGMRFRRGRGGRAIPYAGDGRRGASDLSGGGGGFKKGPGSFPGKGMRGGNR